ICNSSIVHGLLAMLTESPMPVGVALDVPVHSTTGSPQMDEAVVKATYCLVPGMYQSHSLTLLSPKTPLWPSCPPAKSPLVVAVVVRPQEMVCTGRLPAEKGADLHYLAGSDPGHSVLAN